jgi:hypothetical protein
MKGELFLGHHGTSEFRLPLDAVTQTFAALAKKGAGKTYLAGVMEEELAKHRIPFVVIDSMSAHYGIKERYPVVVFGGPSGDVPISPDIGAERAAAAGRFPRPSPTPRERSAACLCELVLPRSGVGVKYPGL